MTDTPSMVTIADMGTAMWICPKCPLGEVVGMHDGYCHQCKTRLVNATWEQFMAVGNATRGYWW